MKYPFLGARCVCITAKALGFVLELVKLLGNRLVLSDLEFNPWEVGAERLICRATQEKSFCNSLNALFPIVICEQRNCGFVRTLPTFLSNPSDCFCFCFYPQSS